MRLFAIGLMCAAMICFTGLDASSKWLGARVPTFEIVWARYVGSAVIALTATRSWARPHLFRSKRPSLQGFRSLLAESSTIGFLNPIFVALLAVPFLGERVGREQVVAIAVGLIGVVIATRPGSHAFQPIVLLAIGGVVMNAGYIIATRKLAGRDPAQTTLIWTQSAGVLLVTPFLPWIWRWPESPQVWLVLAGLGVFGAAGHGLLIVAHKFGPAPVLAPFFYTQLIWMILSGLIVFGDWPQVSTLIGAALVTASGAFLALRERSAILRKPVAPARTT